MDNIQFNPTPKSEHKLTSEEKIAKIRQNRRIIKQNIRLIQMKMEQNQRMAEENLKIYQTLSDDEKFVSDHIDENKDLIQ